MMTNHWEKSVELLSYLNTRGFYLSSHLVLLICPSNLEDLHVLEHCPLGTITNKTDLPTLHTVLLQFLGQQGLFLLTYSDEEASTGLSSVSLKDSEVLNFVLDLDQVLVNWQSLDDKFNIVLLGFSEVVRVAEDPETSDVCAGVSLVLGHQSSPHVTKGSHLPFSSIVSLDQVILFGLTQDLLSLLLIRLQPLHCIDSQSSSQRFGQDKRVSRLSKVWHCETTILNDSYRAASHHRPGIVDCLTASDLSLSLFCSVSEALNHEGRADVFLQFVHIGRDSQNHQDFFDGGDSHCVEVRDSIAEGNATEHVGRLDQGVEEVEGGDEGIGRYFDGGDIWGFDADRFGEFGEVGEKFVLGYFAASSFHFGVVGHDEVGLESIVNWIKGFPLRRLPVCRIFRKERLRDSRQSSTKQAPLDHNYNQSHILLYSLYTVALVNRRCNFLFPLDEQKFWNYFLIEIIIRDSCLPEPSSEIQHPPVDYSTSTPSKYHCQTSGIDSPLHRTPPKLLSWKKFRPRSIRCSKAQPNATRPNQTKLLLSKNWVSTPWTLQNQWSPWKSTSGLIFPTKKPKRQQQWKQLSTLSTGI